MTAYAEVAAAWDMYRRFQHVRWPATGGREIILAQSRLWHLIEPFASGRDAGTADLAAIEAAAAVFAATVRRHCGDTAGDYVTGTITEGERAA